MRRESALLIFAAAAALAGGGLAAAAAPAGAPGRPRAPEPTILSVEDVPGDQGGQVLIEFASSDLDEPGSSTPISDYEVYRRVGASATGRRSPGSWEIVGGLPASFAPSYALPVPTVADSTPSGVVFSVYRVRAVVGPGVFFDSAPDSGYSRDNLPPSAPTNFVYDESSTLLWDASPDADFRFFSIYGSDLPDFDATAVLLGQTTATTLDVQDLPYPWYYITATDSSGNEGPAATAAGVLIDVPVSPDDQPTLFAKPNPFRAQTTISYRIRTAGPVTISVYDVLGRRVETLIDDVHREPARYELPYRPTTAMGMFVIRLQAGELVETRTVVRIR